MVKDFFRFGLIFNFPENKLVEEFEIYILDNYITIVHRRTFPSVHVGKNSKYSFSTIIITNTVCIY